MTNSSRHPGQVRSLTCASSSLQTRSSSSTAAERKPAFLTQQQQHTNMHRSGRRARSMSFPRGSRSRGDEVRADEENLPQTPHGSGRQRCQV